jgi:hypothetical protein
VPGSYALNAEVAVAKVIDGEAIVINVVTGRYYSLEGSAAVAWEALAAGATAAEAAQALAAAFDVEAAAVEGDAERLAEELRDEDLLVLVDEAPTRLPAATDAVARGAAERPPYAAPRMVTFSDMEELLAFDPPLPPTDSELWPARPDAA